jgi:SulP family sulfate permease
LYCYPHEEIFKLIRLYTKVDYKTEVLSGLTVALALIPEAVAFALIAGLSPLTGLYAAFVVGLVTSILGGRPGMISESYRCNRSCNCSLGNFARA